MLQTYILNGDIVNTNTFFTNLSEEITSIFSVLPEDNFEIIYTSSEYRLIKKRLMKIRNSIVRLLSIYYPSLDMLALFISTTGSEQLSGIKHPFSRINKFHSLLHNWALELCTITPNPIGYFLFELYLVYINRIQQSESFSVPHSSNSVLTSANNSINSLSKIFSQQITPQYTLSNILGQIVKFYNQYYYSAQQLYVELSKILSVNIDNTTENSSATVYAQLPNISASFSDFRLLYLITGDIVTKHSINYNLEHIIFGRNVENFLTMSAHTSVYEYVSDIFNATIRLFPIVVCKQILIQQKLHQKYCKYVLKIPEEDIKKPDVITTNQIKSIVNKHILEQLTEFRVSIARNLYSSGELLSARDSRIDYSIYLSSIVRSNNPIFERHPVCFNNDDMKKYNKMVSENRKSGSGIIRSRSPEKQSKLEHIRTYIGPFDNNQHLHDYLHTFKLKSKLKLWKLPVKTVRMFVEDDVKKDNSSNNNSDKNSSSNDDSDDSLVPTFTFPHTPFKQYVFIELPAAITPFTLSSIQSAPDDYIKLFLKHLLLKRVLTNNPLILHPTSDNFSDYTTTELYTIPDKKCPSIISLTDILYTSTLSEYNLRSIPISDVITEAVNSPSSSSPDNSFTAPSCNLSSSISRLFSLLLLPPIPSKPLFQRLLLHTIRFRKSYLQFLSNLITLLSKQSLPHSISLTLIDRIIYLKSHLT